MSSVTESTDTPVSRAAAHPAGRPPGPPGAHPGGGAPAPACAQVWGPLVRALHGSLAASVPVAVGLTAEETDLLHHWAGYAAAALVAFRLARGLAGPRYARFGGLLRRPSTARAWLDDLLRGRERR